MLIVAGTISIDPADAEKLGPAAAAMMAATHEEPGCQAYVFSISVADPSSVQVFEIWDSAEDLEAHFAMPHMATFQAALADITITGRDLNRYEVASSQPM